MKLTLTLTIGAFALGIGVVAARQQAKPQLPNAEHAESASFVRLGMGARGEHPAMEHPVVY